MGGKEIKEIKDGEWTRPKMKGYIHKCCDCGLKHKVDFKVFFDEEDPAPIEMKWTRIK